MNHGQLATVSVELADGCHDIRCVIVEVKRVPRNRRRRIKETMSPEALAVIGDWIRGEVNTSNR